MSTPAAAGGTERLVLHATTVAWGDRGLVLLGPSGSGKSAIALEMMAWGCRLVADDRTELRREGDRIIAAAPPGLPPLIEARGIGLLPAELQAEAEVAALLDLALEEETRLPPPRIRTILSVPVPCLHKPATERFSAALLQYLKAGRYRPALE
ncbi:HPr kinase/phosphorylase [Rubellimicrobium sp. CFH 75288]|uniref:HPr kinase/phosphorylase n=1 Tax=Rubellimicrobium sp. CFH 75288 TaxID=2697034 RepID=UPI0014128F98|nr:HPr kinase/phosphatase C-terminal domain-containing protein [Rubellimicrobium sp. CFH 75288]NAZ37939.1 serine kinase [Rubellimicrobium sp. CFH 75288]